jgi:hypothetical protein
MAMRWAIDAKAHLVVVSGNGRIDRKFLEAYLAAMTAAGCKFYRKLFDLTDGEFLIDKEDLDSVETRLLAFGEDGTAGPVAFVVSPASPLVLDMAVVLKKRVGANRPFRIFVTVAQAMEWLRTASVRPDKYRRPILLAPPEPLSR